MNKLFFLLFSFLLIFNVSSQEIMVQNITEYNKALKSAKPGTTIVLKNGIWKDVRLRAYGKGERDNPILVRAETPGKVIITGSSTLSIYGSYVTVSGLWFKDGGTTKKSVVSFRKDSKTFANNCRLTNSTISYYTYNGMSRNHWIDIFGKNNRVDHCNITGKRSGGTTLVVWLREDASRENGHRIDHNYFGKRPPLGANGGETIRIGTSTNSMQSSKTLVEKNIFESCNGEAEIISNKSCDNIYRDNLFLKSQGSLTLRHGKRALVENNVFLGNGIKYTGGVRIIDEGHIVRNNFMIGLLGTGERGPIVVMNGVPNSPLDRYFQVKNASIQNNTIINCGAIVFGEGKDDEKSLAPINTVFANNLVINDQNKKICRIKDKASVIKFSGNITNSSYNKDKTQFTNALVNFEELYSFPVPTENNEVLKQAKPMQHSPTEDINNDKRDTYVAGAFNLGSKKLPKALKLRVGPGWKPDLTPPKRPVEEVTVKLGSGRLRRAISKANSNSILYLKSGTYRLKTGIRVNKNIQIIGADDGSTIIEADEERESDLPYFFKLGVGSKLSLKNVTLEGKTKNVKYAFLSPGNNESESYSLFLNGVTVRNINTTGGSIFRAYKGTKADTISIVNSRLVNNFRGLNLTSDKKELNKYNAEVIIVKNTLFKDFQEYAIDYVRKVSSPNLSGGKLQVENCLFSNVNNKENGVILKTNGINDVKIKNSVFVDSYKVKYPFHLKGKNNSANNSLFNDSGFPKFSRGAKEIDLIFSRPKWKDKEAFIPSAKSKLLKSNNKREHIGLIKN